MKAFNAVLAICTSEIVNGILKWLFIWPRPFWIEPGVSNKRNTFETDSSFPSSHAQLTMTFVVVCGFQFGGAAVWASLSILSFVTVASAASTTASTLFMTLLWAGRLAQPTRLHGTVPTQSKMSFRRR